MERAAEARGGMVQGGARAAAGGRKAASTFPKPFMEFRLGARLKKIGDPCNMFVEICSNRVSISCTKHKMDS